MIVIIDYNMGNVASVRNMLKKIGYEAEVSNSPAILEHASKIILPGVGAFDHGITSLQQLNLTKVINDKVLNEKTPILGICLGMQLLTHGSEEGKLEGLKLIEGYTQKFSNNLLEKKLKIPHMGWNFIHLKSESKLLEQIDDDSRYYFVHSYHVVCEHKHNSIATSEYGYEFTSIVQNENIYGVQFHPEKSHRFGMKLLKNFVELT